MSELYITPENYPQHTGAGQDEFNFDGQPRLLNARPPQQAYGQVAGVRAVEDVVTLIPRDEWRDRIKEIDEQGSWLKNAAGELPVKDQNGLGYCHAYGTISPMEIARKIQGYPYVELSAESVGGIVTNWRNEGAYPEDDLAVAVKYGACAQSFMDKPHSLNSKKWKEGWEKNALKHRALEWFDLRVPNKTFDAVVTCILLRFPIGLGYAWWGHFVHGGFKARYNASKKCFDIENRNSWGKSYGDNGYFWLQEGERNGQGTPDWAFGIRHVTPSND